MRRYSDSDLVDAVRASHSWRGVLRALGLSATSAAAMRSVRAHADRLQLDTPTSPASDAGRINSSPRQSPPPLVGHRPRKRSGWPAARAPRQCAAMPYASAWKRPISRCRGSRSHQLDRCARNRPIWPGLARSWLPRGLSSVAIPFHGRWSLPLRPTRLVGNGGRTRPGQNNQGEARDVMDSVDIQYRQEAHDVRPG